MTSVPHRCRRIVFQLTCLVLLTCSLQVQTVMAEESTSASRAEILERGKALLRADQPAEAFELLISYEAEFSGNNSYDYLLGVAAVDSDHAGEAIFSLQRVVAEKPDFSGARLELARAYFATGDNELARTEFERLQSEDPPAKVSTLIADYLEIITQRARSYQSGSQYFFDIGSGYDSNPAAATADDQFLTFTLDDKNVEQSSAFMDVAAGANWNKPLTPDTQLILGGRLGHRSNPSAHFVDPTTAEANAAINWESGVNAASISASTMVLRLDGESNKQDSGLSLNYSRELNERWRIDTLLRGGAIRFDDALEVQDVDQWLVGLGVTRTGSNTIFNFGLLAQEDDAKENGSPFSNDVIGARLSGIWFRPGGHSYTIDVMALNTDFDDPFFGFEREDDLYSVTVGSTWERFPVRGWSLTLQLTYSEKTSTVNLYEYERFEAGILLRKILTRGQKR